MPIFHYDQDTNNFTKCPWLKLSTMGCILEPQNSSQAGAGRNAIATSKWEHGDVQHPPPPPRSGCLWEFQFPLRILAGSVRQRSSPLYPRDILFPWTQVTVSLEVLCAGVVPQYLLAQSTLTVGIARENRLPLESKTRATVIHNISVWYS